MSELLPFRPWRFANANLAWAEELKNPERKADDRSPFVRYARSAALFSQLVRDQEVTLAVNPELPSINSGGIDFHYGVAKLDDIRTTMSVLPSAKEHIQRVLEGIQLYIDPIVVVSNPVGGYLAVGQHELLAAAKAYQDEMRRPGKERSSDFCLVAVASEKILDQVQVQPLAYENIRGSAETVKGLVAAGYSLSPRTDDPSTVSIDVEGQQYSKSVANNANWKEELMAALGVRSLDLNSIREPESGEPSGKKNVLTAPTPSINVLKSGFEAPYNAYRAQILPPSGVMMWSLRDFRNA